MGYFDKLGDSLVSAGKDVAQKAKTESEVAKLKLDIKTKESYVEKQYTALGSAYYRKHKDDEQDEAHEQMYLITEALDEIARLRTEVLKLRGATECPKCGASMPAGVAFCSKCGAKLDDMGLDADTGTDASPDAGA